VTFALVTDDHDATQLVTAVDHKPKTTTRLARLANIVRDPTATLLVDYYDDDWSMLWWVRLRGVGTVVEPGSGEHQRAVDALVEKYVQYRERPPGGPAIIVAVTGIRGWAAVG
jgi:PPOX class probable F420-dependent enzyme